MLPMAVTEAAVGDDRGDSILETGKVRASKEWNYQVSYMQAAAQERGRAFNSAM